MTFKSSWFAIAIALLCCSFLPTQEAEDVSQLKRKIEALERQNRELERENAELKREVQKLRTTSEDRKKAAVAEDPFQPGKVWRGKGDTESMKTIKLVSRNGEMAVFEAEGFAEGSWFRFTGKVHGKLVQVDDIKRFKHPKGQEAPLISKPKGTIRISGDGNLSVSCAARMRIGGGEHDWKYNLPSAKPQ